MKIGMTKGRALQAAIATLFLCWIPSSNAQEKATPITITTPVLRSIEYVEHAVGVIESRFSPKVAAEVSGEVVKIYADEGQGVDTAARLADIASKQYTLERDVASAEVGRLKALIVHKKSQVSRAHELQTKNLVSDEQVDQVEAELAAMIEQLAAAKARLGDTQRKIARTEVRAPVAGQVSQRLVGVGDFVDIGDVMFELVDMQNLRVRLQFPEYLAPQLKRDLMVRMTSVAAGNQGVTATISEVRPGVNAANRAVNIIIDFSNPGLWQPGASVIAEVVLATRDSSLMVPQRSLVLRPNGHVVYVIDNGIAHERIVRAGQVQGDRIEILEGLSIDEVIAVDGAGFLTAEATVDVKEAG